jgi:long-chain fatty acid transport protein
VRKLAKLLILLAMTPAPALGSGFLLHEQTATALGRAGAMVADAPGASAVWFNPAALSDGADAGIELTAAALSGNARFTPQDGAQVAETRRRTHVLPSLFAHQRLGDRWQLGLGLFAPFGLVVRWPDDWVGAENAIDTDLRLLAANLVAAFRLSPRWSLGGGLTVARGSLKLSAALPSMVGGGRVQLEGDGWGVGANVAVRLHLLPERLHVGASYGSRMRVPIDGRADFTLVNPTFADALPDQGASTTVTFPDVFSAGATLRVWPWLALHGQVDWVLWSTFDELRVDFQNRATTPYLTSVRNAGNPFTGRLAAELTLPRGFAARTGVSLDGQALPAETLAPSTPDGTRVGLGIGVGWAWRRLQADVGYLYTHFLDSRATGGREGPAGTYRTRAHAAALTLGVR